ncbi:hypothetical protein FEM48_Zijuj10G0032100 [Ziziphus jujuba var. spinosa]|uniref:Uncharacterized protein n=1 Tax=Ziziphus jujuba var. spinosa TaxID=714518 RepID=A0A978UKY8_ZIZJJ|nr:hypothetical protein FEM48_Zijuj10G0032100 [Ziziphus jujuba var. spinosa]
MGFIKEFAENLILRLMEDPKERDRKFREHVYAVKDRCNKTKEMWSYPLRPYGFWTFERHNSQLRWDAQISQVPGGGLYIVGNRRVVRSGLDTQMGQILLFATFFSESSAHCPLVSHLGFDMGLISPGLRGLGIHDLDIEES